MIGYLVEASNHKEDPMLWRPCVTSENIARRSVFMIYEREQDAWLATTKLDSEPGEIYRVREVTIG